MTERTELPAVHLSVDDLEKIEKLLRENTTNYEIEVGLSLPGGVELKFHSVDQIDSSLLGDVRGATSYSLSVAGEEGKCTIAGESTGTECHMLYCEGNSDWKGKIRYVLREYLSSIQATKSHLRGRLTGRIATGVAVLAALFVGWAMTAVAPQSVVHYYPTLLDAFIFSLGAFGLLIVRYRNWVHPYIWIGYDRSYPTKLRIGILGILAILLTLAVLVIRSLLEPGPFVR